MSVVNTTHVIFIFGTVVVNSITNYACLKSIRRQRLSQICQVIDSVFYSSRELLYVTDAKIDNDNSGSILVLEDYLNNL